MKILFLTTEYPYPSDTGGKIRTLQILKLLSKNHKIHLVCFGEIIKMKGRKALDEYIQKKKIFNKKINSNNNLLQTLKKILFSFFSDKPYRISKFYSLEVDIYLRKIIAKEKFEIIVVDQLPMAQYSNFFKKTTKKFLSQHNLESELTHNLFINEKNYFKKFLFLNEYHKIRKFENNKLKLFDEIITISNADKEKLKLSYPQKKIRTLPVFFNSKKYFLKDMNIKKYDLIFVGLLSWRPNDDGILWFCEEVLPKIKKLKPEIALCIVGGFPSNKLIKISKMNSKIKLTGYVENVDNYLKQSKIFVNPIRIIGGGVRIKVLKALSSGLPIVSTSTGVRGLGLQNNNNILINDNADGFAKNVINLLENEDYYNRICYGGGKYYENYLEKYSQVVKKFKL